MMKRLIILAPVLLVGCVFHARPSGWIPARMPLTAERMVEMKNAGQSDASIWQELEFHGVAYKLNADDLVGLKDAGAGDALLSAAARAPVKSPQEARPVYERHAHRHYHHGCDYCYSAVPIYVATALSLNYIFGHHWGHSRHRSRW